MRLTKENNFLYLFIALLGLLFFTAILNQTQIEWLDSIVNLIVFFVFILGVHSLKTDSSWTWAVYFFALLVVLIFIIEKLFATKVTQYIHLLILLIFFIGSFKISFKQILMSKSINKNMLIGSVVLYLLLGLIWSIFYLFLLSLYPDSFSGLEALPWQENFSKVSYFSFVTLTTLGYGDISPKNSISEFFVYMEAIVGVFYMAIIVASIVSARLEDMKK